MIPVRDPKISNGVNRGSLIILSVVGLDQLTKHWARTGTLFTPVIQSPGFFNWYVTAGFLLGFIFLYRRYWHGSRTAFGFFLIVGGALSNIFDQLTKGSVTDFINLWISTANLADFAIMIGIVYFIICFKKSIPRQS